MRKNRIGHNDKYGSKMTEKLPKGESRDAHFTDAKHSKLHAFADRGTGNTGREKGV